MQGLCQEQGSPANSASCRGSRAEEAPLEATLKPQAPSAHHFTIMLSRGSAEDRGASGAEGIPDNVLPTWGFISQQELGWGEKLKQAGIPSYPHTKAGGGPGCWSVAAPRNWKMNTPLVKKNQITDR